MAHHSTGLVFAKLLQICETSARVKLNTFAKEILKFLLEGLITKKKVEMMTNSKTVHAIATKFGIQLWGVEISSYPASK